MINLLYNSIKKRWFSILLITFNSTISIILLYNLLISSSVNTINEKVIDKYVKINNVIMLEYDGFSSEPEKVGEDIYKINEFLKNKDVKFGGYTYTNSSFKELEDNNNYINLNKTIWKNEVASQYPSTSKIMYIDKNIIKFMENKNEILKEFLKYNNTDDFIPLIVGNKYKNIFKIGQELTDIQDVKYKIIGFLNDNTSWLDKDNFYRNIPISLDDVFLMPFNNKSNFNQFAIVAMAKSYIIETKNLNEVNIIKNQLQMFGSEEGIGINPISIYDITYDMQKNKNYNITFMSLISVCIIIFVIIINSISMISSIEDRTYDIAVMISQGASNKFLTLYVILENILVFICSLIFALVLNFFNGSSKILFIYINKQLDLKNLIIVLVVYFAMCIISSIIPIKKILNIKPNILLMEN